MSLFLDFVANGATLMLVTLGLAVVLGLMNVINLAHTGFMAVGVYAAVALVGIGWGFWPALAGATLFTGVIGAVVERCIVRRLYHRPLDTILATWGLSLVLVQSISWIFGRAPVALTTPVPGAVALGPFEYSAFRLLLVAAAIIAVTSLVLLLRYTRVGLRIRMVMTNEALARGVGIDTMLVRQLTFVAGAAMAGAAGALLGPVQGISPNYALGYMAPAFLTVLLSGGTLGGLVLACAVLATTQTLFAMTANPVYAGVVVLAVAVTLLRIKPEGLTWRRS